MPHRVFLDIIKDKRSKCVQTKKNPRSPSEEKTTRKHPCGR